MANDIFRDRKLKLSLAVIYEIDHLSALHKISESRVVETAMRIMMDKTAKQSVERVKYINTFGMDNDTFSLEDMDINKLYVRCPWCSYHQHKFNFYKGSGGMGDDKGYYDCPHCKKAYVIHGYIDTKPSLLYTDGGGI